MPSLEELLAQVDAETDNIVALEQALVRIPSVNTGFMPTGDETPVCEYARDWLAEDGIPSEILESAPNRGNIIARIEGQLRQRRPLVHVAHRRRAGGRGGQVAVRAIQRHPCGWARVRTRRVGLQGPTHRSALWRCGC